MDTTRMGHTKSVADHVFWLFLFQGILSLLIAFLVLIYPYTIPALIAAMFIWSGVTAIVLAWRVRKFGNDILQ